MRIAFLGKGGSGKTSLAAGYIRHLCQHTTSPILAIDADHNTNLHHTLGLSKPAQTLGSMWSALVEYVRGTRADLFKDTLIGTTPPSTNSNFFTLRESTTLLEQLTATRDNLRLMEVGSFAPEDVGHNCYHGKLDGLNLFMSHLLDRDDERVVIDATAGLDLFGTPLLYSYDLLVVVVEPTQKSLDVYEQLVELHGTDNLVVIGNKVETSDDAAFLKNNIESPILGHIADSNSLRAFEQGDTDAFEQFVADNVPLWQALDARLSKMSRDWDNYLANQLKAHRKVSQNWFNSYYNVNLEDYIDDTFKYQQVI